MPERIGDITPLYGHSAGSIVADIEPLQPATSASLP
jgi:hypothetical protein